MGAHNANGTGTVAWDGRVWVSDAGVVVAVGVIGGLTISDGRPVSDGGLGLTLTLTLTLVGLAAMVADAPDDAVAV